MDLEKYEALKKKYGLPDLKLINNEFEISSIEESDFLLREIRRKIIEKIDTFIKLIEVMIQPDTSVSDLHECKILDKTKENEVYGLYKRLKTFYRESTLLSIDSEEKNEAEFIKDVFGAWPDIKKKLLEFASRMRDSWKKDIQMHERLGYLG